MANTWGFNTLDDLEEHYDLHREAEKGVNYLIQVVKFNSIDEYGESASNFMNKPLGDDVVECQKPNGEKRWVKYDKKTQEFMVLSPDKKTIITYYYKNLDSRTFANNLRSFLSNCQETRR